MLEAGVEQSFVLRRHWPGGGDLTITGSLDADQALGKPLPDGSGGLIVPFADRSWRLRYGAVTVIDAVGDRRAASLAIADGQVNITVDGAWLATAAYPVVVDPLITIDFGPRLPGAARGCLRLRRRRAARPASYLVAYETNRPVGGSCSTWIGGRIVSWRGCRPARPSTYRPTAHWRTPSRRSPSSSGGSTSPSGTISSPGSAPTARSAIASLIGRAARSCRRRRSLVASSRMSPRRLGPRVAGLPRTAA